MTLLTTSVDGAEPDGFRDIPWGGEEAVVRSRESARFCEDAWGAMGPLLPDAERGDRRCVEAFTFPGMRSIDRAEAHYFFRKNRLYWVLVKFNVRYFEEYREIMSNAYGRPVGSLGFQHEGGDRFRLSLWGRPATAPENEVVEWRWPRTGAMLLKYGTIADSLLLLGSPAEIDRVVERLQREGFTVPRVQP